MDQKNSNALLNLHHKELKGVQPSSSNVYLIKTAQLVNITIITKITTKNALNILQNRISVTISVIMFAFEEIWGFRGSNCSYFKSDLEVLMRGRWL